MSGVGKERQALDLNVAQFYHIAVHPSFEDATWHHK